MDDDERRRLVDYLAGEALERPPARRPSFVDRACGSDAALRAAVVSLLAYTRYLSNFLVEPCLDLKAALRQCDILTSDQDAQSPGPDVRDRSGTPARGFRWLAVALGIIFVLLTGAAAWKATAYADAVTDVGWTARQSANQWRVNRVDPAGPAAGSLRPGDVIVAVDGDSRAGRLGPDDYLQFLQAGSVYSLQTSLDGDAGHEYRLPVVAAHNSGLGLFVLYALIGSCFTAMGLVLGVSKPDERVTRLGCLAGTFAGLRLVGLAAGPYSGLGTGLALGLDQLLWICEPWHLALGYHFFWRFSLPDVSDRVWAMVCVVIYGVCAVHSAVAFALSVATLIGPAELMAVQFDHPRLLMLIDILFHSSFWGWFRILAFAAFCAVVVRGYYRADALTLRRKIHWVVAGCVCGLAPLVIVLTARLALSVIGATRLLERVPWSVLVHIADACLVALPISLAYAIVRHRVLDVSVVVRLGVQYMLAKRVLQALLVLPAILLILPLVEHPDWLFPLRAMSTNLPLIVLFGFSLVFRDRLRRWLDRRFFRDAAAQTPLLGQTIERTKNVGSVPHMAGTVGDIVTAAFHPAFVLVFCQESVERRPARALSLRDVMHATAASAPMLALARAALARMRETPSDQPFDVAAPAGSPESTSALAVPVVRRVTRNSRNDGAGADRSSDGEEVIGLFVLGGKRSEEAYRAAERDLLKKVADHFAIMHKSLSSESQLAHASRLDREPETVLECVCGRCLLESPEAEAARAFLDSGAARCERHADCELTRIPSRIQRRYILERRVGAGGMGAVYNAFDPRLKRNIAVKIMVTANPDSSVAQRRFDREAEALAQVENPHVVGLFDSGRLANVGGNESAYLLMERVNGSTWHAELRQRGKLTWTTASLWLDQVLEGLQAAHEAGVVHRDLKPANVLITRRSDGREIIKLADFGLAKWVDRDEPANSTGSGAWASTARRASSDQSTQITEAESVLGTPGYMSPEQCCGVQCDARSDLFAVAVMTVEAITGVRPEKDYTWAAAQFEAFTRRWGRELPAIREFQTVLRKCLEPLPSERFQTAGQMREALIPCLRACAEAEDHAVSSW